MPTNRQFFLSIMLAGFGTAICLALIAGAIRQHVYAMLQWAPETLPAALISMVVYALVMLAHADAKLASDEQG